MFRIHASFVIVLQTMLFESLFEHAGKTPDDISIIDDSGKYTHRQVAGLSMGLAAYLAGQTSKDKVGLLLPAGAGFAVSFYGTLLAGKSVVPINFLLGERETAHVISDSGIDTIVTIPQLAAKLAGSPLKVIHLPEVIKSIAAAAGSAPKQMPPLPQPKADDLAVLMYTSGTSALPKGVMLTYGNLQSDVEAAITHARLEGKHRFLGIIPLFHSTGLLGTLLAPMTLGAMVVYIARFSPVATLNAIKEHQISLVIAVPSMYGAIVRLKAAHPDDFKGIYAIISGGEPLPAAVREAFQAKLNQPIYEGYGLTETIGPIAFNVPGQNHPGSVGKLIPGAEIKTTDDDGKDLPTGQTGEIWMRGPMIMKGYHNLPKETAAAITPDGFFKSGDIGRMDENGYLHITGRKKELIIVAGEKAVPREIEDVLLKHPAVADAAVVGKKDPSRGEVVVAFVILHEGQTATSDELRDFCRTQNLAQWKCPREVTMVADLPRSPTGKVLKRVLSEQVNVVQ
jgi:long-chain acyl-CoA synthetase